MARDLRNKLNREAVTRQKFGNVVRAEPNIRIEIWNASRLKLNITRVVKEPPRHKTSSDASPPFLTPEARPTSSQAVANFSAQYRFISRVRHWLAVLQVPRHLAGVAAIAPAMVSAGADTGWHDGCDPGRVRWHGTCKPAPTATIPGI
jgi:hypothetical protein